jgi:site-specific recombinase XerC
MTEQLPALSARTRIAVARTLSVVPLLIADAGEQASWRYVEFFTADTLAGLRDRAILAVGLQVGFRRAEIAALNVGDLHQNRGFDALRVKRKGGRREALAINPQATQRIRAYLAAQLAPVEADRPMQDALERLSGMCGLSRIRITLYSRRRKPLTTERI